MSKRVTIKTIAADLGISHMTVSRALSGQPNVQKETRDAIQRRARELGYVKSAAATAMRGDGTRIVGLLLPNIINEFYARFANTMAAACQAQSQHLIIHLTDDDIALEAQAIARLREVQAMAVVMVPAPGNVTHDGSDSGGMRVIQLIRKRPVPDGGAALLVDDAAAIRAAVQHLAGQGHDQIAYIGGPRQLSSGRQRLAAFTSGMQSAGLDPRTDLIHEAAPSHAMGRQAAETLLTGGLATAIISGGFEISNGALSMIMERHSDTRRDIAFVGYGDPSFYAWLNGGISTVHVAVDQLAHKAAELLNDDGVADARDAPSDHVFPARLIVRQS